MAGIDNNTILMLHMDGSDNGTTFTDDSFSSYTVSIDGTVVTKTAEKKFGTASAYFNDTGHLYIDTTNSEWDFGTNDWTIDFWAYFTDIASTRRLWGRGPDGDNRFGLIWSTSNYLYFSNEVSGSNEARAGDSWTPTLNQWYHIAVVRDGTIIRFFVDGDNMGDGGTFSSNMTQSGRIYIGAGLNGGGSVDKRFQGYMDELRVSNVARWTSSFTPPTEPYSAPLFVSGNLTEDARIIVINEFDWSIESNTQETAGSYSIEVTSGSKTIAARKSDGESIAYGNVTPILG